MRNYILNSIDEKEIITEIRDNRNFCDKPEATVVIVTYNQTDLLIQNLNSLQTQTVKDFEIIILDNNEKIDIFPLIKGFLITYIKLNKNYGISLARNMGIKLARGSIVIFLDDDAIPAQDFVEQHVMAYKANKIVGLRGKCKPRNPNNIYNYLAIHYDLGDKILPWYINLEGNSSFRKDVLIEIGGFSPRLEGAGGHEGLELSYRIISEYKDKGNLIYYPKAIIYHDYARNYIHYIAKQIRHRLNKNKITNRFPDIFAITKGYNNGNIVKMKSCNIFMRSRLSAIQIFTRIVLKLNVIGTVLLTRFSKQ